MRKELGHKLVFIIAVSNFKPVYDICAFYVKIDLKFRIINHVKSVVPIDHSEFVVSCQERYIVNRITIEDNTRINIIIVYH